MNLMTGLILVLGILFVFWYTRSKRKALLHYEYKFKLSHLHDKLVLGRVEGKVKNDSLEYEYLDHSILMTINNLRFVNIYSAWGLGKLHGNNPSLIHLQQSLEHKFSLPQNKFLKDIHREFGELLFIYVIKKDATFKWMALLFSFWFGEKPTSPKTQRRIRDFRYYPETSASAEFISC